MTAIDRRGFLLAGAATFATPYLARAQEIVPLRFSTAASEADVRFAAFDILASRIAKFAAFEPHYSATLFAQGTEIPAIQRGNLDMAMPNPQEIAKQVPEWSVFTAGYLIRDAEHLIKIFEAEVGQEMYALAEEKLGLKFLGVMYSGTRQLNLRGDKKIMKPEDLAGVRLRMPGSEAWQFLGKALGANPTPLPFTEVYTALQTGAIDGQDNPLATNQSAKFYEVTDQIVLTSHFVGCDFLAISREVWDGFDAGQQATVQRAATDTIVEIRRIVTDAEAELAAFFREQGLQVYEPDIDAFRIKVQADYLASAYANDWPEGIIERINAVA